MSATLDPRSRRTGRRRAAQAGRPAPVRVPGGRGERAGERPVDPRRRPARPAARLGLADPDRRRRRRSRPTRPARRSSPARALTEGTERYDAIALVEASERLGASLHAEAGWDALSVGVDVPAARLAPALELAAEVLLQPTFPEPEVERLRDERLNDLLQAKADPRRRVEEAFVGTIYAGASPYHRPSGGTRETVEGLTAADLRRAYGRSLDPARATLVVGGDLGDQDVVGLGRAPVRRLGRRRRAGRRRVAPVVDTGSHGRPGRPGRPSAGLGPDRDPHRPPRAAAPDRRLPRRLGHERHPRRAVQLAAQHEAARGEGLHLRRGRRVRHAPRRRPVLGPGRGQHRGHGPGHRRHAGRARPGCATRRSPTPSSRPRATS